MVIKVGVLEMQGDLGPVTLFVTVTDLIGAVARGAPINRGVLAQPTGQELHFVSHHERRVKPNAEPPDDVVAEISRRAVNAVDHQQ